MKYAVDQINDGVCVLEEINTGQIVEVDISFMPEGIKEKNIVILKNGKYELDGKTESVRKNSLRKRLEMLKKLKK